MAASQHRLPGTGGIQATSSGAGYLLRGFALLKHKRILPFVIAPLLINIALFYFGLGYLYEWFTGWLTPFMDRIPAWLAFVEWLLTALFYLAALLLVAFGFTFVANLVGSPFYGLMAEQVELIQLGSTNSTAFSGLALLRSVPGAIARELKKLVYYLLHALPILLLSLAALVITPLATLMPFIWFWFGAKMLALEYIDYAYDNNQLAFSTLRADLKAHKHSRFGFGAITTLASMIPVLNILTIPAAVCGGTLFYLERAWHSQEKNNRAPSTMFGDTTSGNNTSGNGNSATSAPAHRE
ncbi:MAG: sulfate transporter CysZ [Pseudomonadales bacterium]|nr:sulfate transporter CysZ [Pseudomonadales bacterium]